MKKIYKIVSRVLIISIIMTIITFITIKSANYLYTKGQLPDSEVCERCSFGTFICWNTVKLDPCEVTDGRVIFYLLALIIWSILLYAINYIIESNTDFNFTEWIKGE